VLKEKLEVKKQFRVPRSKLKDSCMLKTKQQVPSSMSGKTIGLRLTAIGLLLCSMVLLCEARSGYAEILGDIIKPFASVTEMYDSNIFRVRDKEMLKSQFNSDRMSDWITVFTAGTDIHYAYSGQEANLSYKRDFLRYMHHASQNTDSDDAKGSLSLTIIDGLKFKADGLYNKAPESRIYYISSQMNMVTRAGGGAAVSYDMPLGIGLEAAYRRERITYTLTEFRPTEYYTDIYSGTVSYKFNVDTKIYATLQRAYTFYKEDQFLNSVLVNNDSVSDSIIAGFNNSISAKTSVSFYIGYLQRRHKEFSARDFSGLIGKAEIKYELTPLLSLLANAERQLYEETYADRLYSVNDSVGTGLQYLFTPNIKALAMGKLTWKQFRDVPGLAVPKRTDRYEELNAGIEWKPFDRVTASIGYQYSRRTSDDNTYKFTDHIVISSISYHF
jgi:opacity protein-like surface antigen